MTVQTKVTKPPMTTAEMATASAFLKVPHHRPIDHTLRHNAISTAIAVAGLSTNAPVTASALEFD